MYVKQKGWKASDYHRLLPCSLYIELFHASISIICDALLSIPYWLLLIELYWCYRMGCVFLWIHFTVIHSFQSNFRSVLKLTQAHEWPIRVSMWIFLSCYIRHSFTIPKGLLLVLYSNGLARYPSRDIVRGHDTCQVGFAFVPCLVLVLQSEDPSELRSGGQVRHLFPSTLLVGCFLAGS